jgi:hypothetical protein
LACAFPTTAGSVGSQSRLRRNVACAYHRARDATMSARSLVIPSMVINRFILDIILPGTGHDGSVINVQTLLVDGLIYRHIPQRAAAHRPETSRSRPCGVTGRGGRAQPPRVRTPHPRGSSNTFSAGSVQVRPIQDQTIISALEGPTSRRMAVRLPVEGWMSRDRPSASARVWHNPVYSSGLQRIGEGCSSGHAPQKRAANCQMGQCAHQLPNGGREVQCLCGRRAVQLVLADEIGFVVVHRSIPITAPSPSDTHVTIL